MWRQQREREREVVTRSWKRHGWILDSPPDCEKERGPATHIFVSIPWLPEQPETSSVALSSPACGNLLQQPHLHAANKSLCHLPRERADVLDSGMGGHSGLDIQPQPPHLHLQPHIHGCYQLTCLGTLRHEPGWFSALPTPDIEPLLCEPPLCSPRTTSTSASTLVPTKEVGWSFIKLTLLWFQWLVFQKESHECSSPICILASESSSALPKVKMSRFVNAKVGNTGSQLTLKITELIPRVNKKCQTIQITTSITVAILVSCLWSTTTEETWNAPARPAGPCAFPPGTGRKACALRPACHCTCRYVA
jgi:hypothetical protein